MQLISEHIRGISQSLIDGTCELRTTDSLQLVLGEIEDRLQQLEAMAFAAELDDVLARIGELTLAAERALRSIPTRRFMHRDWLLADSSIGRRLEAIAEGLDTAGESDDDCDDSANRGKEHEGESVRDDPSAYVPAKRILDEFPSACPTYKRLHRILSQEPGIRRWKSNKQRLSVHAGDFMRWLDGRARTQDDWSADREDIERRREQVQRRKVSGSTSRALPASQEETPMALVQAVLQPAGDSGSHTS